MVQTQGQGPIQLKEYSWRDAKASERDEKASEREAWDSEGEVKAAERRRPLRQELGSSEKGKGP